jgi:tetratricopeptide (TPR) repeat protein
MKYNNLRQIYQAQGSLGKAARYAQKALIIDLKLFGENHFAVAIDYNNLGLIYHEQGNIKKAVKYLQKSLIIGIKLYGIHHPIVAAINSNLQQLKLANSNFSK